MPIRPNSGMRFRGIEFARLTLVIMASAVLALSAWARLDPKTWDVPLSYSTDGLQIMTWIKAAQEGQYYPVLPIAIERLGAPFHANWNDYPMYEKTITMLIGWLARWIGLFAAANFAVLLAHVSSAVSFYLCCRLLRHRWEWSFAGSLLFAFSYYAMWRGLPHLLLSYSYTIPPALLTCWIFASRQLLRRKACRIFCFGTMAVMGASNPYNLILFLQLFGLTVLIRYLTRREPVVLRHGLAAIGISLATFAVVNAGTFVYAAREGRNPNAIDRKYFECEQFALKPLEMVVPPPTHNISAFSDIGRHYDGLFKLPGETFSAYLGIIGLAALGWMLVEFLMRSLQRPTCRNSVHIWYIGWVFVYSMVGGLNNLAALAGFTILRATNRFSIFISALLLLFLVARMSRLTRAWSRPKSLLLATVILVVGVADQVPFGPARNKFDDLEKALQTDRVFFGKLEQLLDPGTMVFELPVMEFPESGPILNLGDYQPVRGYLHSTSLRFSYGSNKGRPRDDWQQVAADLPPALMITELESLGFGAILIHRDAFSDRAQSLVRFLAESGRGQMIEDETNGTRVCIRLEPADPPRLPKINEYIPIDFGDGWDRWDLTRTHSRRWTTGLGKVAFRNSSNRKENFRISAEVQALSTVRLTLSQGETELWVKDLAPGAPIPLDVVIPADPGTNHLHFRIEGNPGAMGARKALAVSNSRMRAAGP
jgi:hypothetical protein